MTAYVDTAAMRRKYARRDKAGVIAYPAAGRDIARLCNALDGMVTLCDRLTPDVGATRAEVGVEMLGVMRGIPA